MSRASLVAALGLSAVPIAGAVMEYTDAGDPAVVAESETVDSAAGKTLGETVSNRSSGDFSRRLNAADTTADAAVARAAAEAAEAFAKAGPAVTEVIPVATSESTRNSSE